MIIGITIGAVATLIFVVIIGSFCWGDFQDEWRRSEMSYIRAEYEDQARHRMSSEVWPPPPEPTGNTA